MLTHETSTFRERFKIREIEIFDLDPCILQDLTLFDLDCNSFRNFYKIFSGYRLLLIEFNNLTKNVACLQIFYG